MTLTKYLYGPLTRFGIVVALATAVADQVTKLWVLFLLETRSAGSLADLALIQASEARFPAEIKIGPFITIVLTWNTGISYGLFPQVGPLGQWALLGVKAVAVVLLWVWLAHATSRLTALALGLIIGGAIGNAIDRAALGFVTDFIDVQRLGFFPWIFNIADSAITLGVVALLADSFRREQPAETRASKEA